jgi:hypothetical protein
MKLYIPRLGDVLTLSKEWSFKLYNEGRNDSLLNHFGLEWKQYHTSTPYPYPLYSKKYYDWINTKGAFEEWKKTTYDKWLKEYLEWKKENDFYTITFDAGTQLKVDRIFIRKGAAEFDSVTFNVVTINGNKAKKLRFWVKLDDANELEFER